MTTKLIWFMLSFIGALAAVPALAVLLIFIFKLDFDRFIAQHGMLFAVLLGFLGIYSAFMFFCLQDVFIVFSPEPGSPRLPKAELVQRIEESFSAPVEGRRLFDVLTTDDKVIITWSSSLDYFQITNVGGVGKKRVVVLTFDEQKGNAYFVMKEKDWRWNLSKDAVNFSFNYSLGIFAEYSTELYPSIEFTRSGIKADMKRITYNSNDLWLPIQKALLSSGWTARGGMIPKTSVRILFCIPVALLFFGMGMFIKVLGPPTPGSTTMPRQPSISTASKSQNGSREGRQTQPPNQSDLAAQIAFTTQHITAENIEAILDGLMKTPPKYINDEIRTSFIAYSNGYLAKNDKKDDFVTKLRRFAHDNKIDGLKQ